jgi:uncharacterized membrane protein YhaH (DUF805 family)
MSWYLATLKKYATFGGRARRKEYWMFSLFNFIFAFCIGFAEVMMGMGGESAVGPASLLFAVAVTIPGIAVMVRRLHDTDRSGWWFWVALVPVLGTLALLYFMLQEGTKGGNQYGSDPKNPVGPVPYEEPQRTAAPVA